jgi:glycosyltransferase involved in cell wall biosynthesis
MKVLHLSAADSNSGAGKATLLTHIALSKEKGIVSKILYLKSNDSSSEIVSYADINILNKIKQKIYSFFDRLPLIFYQNKNESIFSPGLSGVSLKNNDLIKWADIIHIHWANHGFIDINEINKWNKPIVWTLRDMWAFTGGCHYSFECDNYIRECGSCVALGSNKENDLSAKVLKHKLSSFSGVNIKWIAISSWMKEQAQKSTLLKKCSIEVIPSGVLASNFKSLDKTVVKEKLKLPINKKIVLLGATDIRQKFKGFEYAKKTLNKLPKDLLIVTFGSGGFLKGEIPQEFINFGDCSTEKLNELYVVADVFLGPSIAEAMGKTFLEAQLNGLPVVCFDKTGPVDIIKHKITGYISKFKNIEDLEQGVLFCLNNTMDKEKITSMAQDKFDISKVALSYKKVYKDILINSVV